MRLAAYILVAFAFSSCATLFNKPSVPVKIYSNEPARLVINNDTLDGKGKGCEVTLYRSKKPFYLTAYTDSLSRTFKIRSKNSFAFLLNWANLGPYSLIGLAVDWKKSKRYTYPRFICINVRDSSIRRYTNDPLFNFVKDTKEPFYFNQVKIQPLKLFSDIRGVFVSYERLYKQKHSTEISAAYIFDPFFVKNISTWPNMYGHSFGIEQKLFIGKVEHGLNYISMEANYRKFQCDFINSFAIPQPKDSIENAHLHLDTVKVNHKAYTLNFKFGQQYSYKNLIFEWAFGIGVRYRNVKHENKLHPNDYMIGPRHPNTTYAILGEGEYMNPNVYLGMKIGYRF